MQAKHPGPRLAIVLLSLLTLLAGCTNAYYIALPQPPGAPTVATPIISPPGGSFSAPITVTLTDATPNATIYYTTNGTTPTTASTPYTAPIPVSTSETISAIATAPGYTLSPIATAAYIISIPIPQAATPTFTPPAGTYTSAQSVTISDTTPGATIYYTTNGTTPTTSSTLYSAPITVAASETIEAIATAPGYTASAIATAAYIISIPIPQTATPTFSPPAGTYTSAQSVTISDTTPGATIYYTTNGTTPTTSSTLYTTPIPVSTSETIEAIAIAPGYTTSPIATAAYIIQIPTSTCANPGPGIICTIAGDGIYGYNGDGITATSAELWAPYGVAIDSSGNVYIADSANSRVRKVTPAGIISTFAGNGIRGFSGDSGPAVNAELGQPANLAFDASGNLYFSDVSSNRIRKVTTAGIISTVAGTGGGGFSGDGGPATSATLDAPNGLAFDASGNLYIADSGNERIRKVTPVGVISTVAGNGIQSFGGDGGSATAAGLSEPVALAFDASGNLYINDFANLRIRKVTPAGIISTFAGTGVAGYSGDGGPAASAQLDNSECITIDAAGNLLIADSYNNRIRKVTPSGIISTVVGNGSAGFTGDGGLATSAELNLPFGVAVDPAGNLYLSDLANQRIREVFNSTTATPTFTPPAGTYTSTLSVTIADTTPNATIYYTTNGTTPTTSSTLYTAPIPVSTSETLEAIAIAPGYTTSPVATAAYIISIPTPQAANPTFSPPAGTYTSAQSVTISDTTPGAQIYYTTNGTTPTISSTLYTAPIPVSTSETIEAIAIAPGYTTSPVAIAAYIIQIPNGTCTNHGPGIICTVAGNGVAGSTGDGGPATSAALDTPWGVALDANGNLYIGDPNGHRVRKVTAGGIISTVAGGPLGYSGDGGPATSAGVGVPDEVALDTAGNFYLVDEDCACVRKVDSAGIISTIAGNGTQNSSGNAGDGGPATSAQLYAPIGIKFDAAGNLYIADRYAERIRRVTPAGIISTVVGNGLAGYSGDGGPATSASLNLPYDVAFDAAGNMYISDAQDGRIRRVTPTGIISTFAGSGTSGYSGDGGPAISAQLNNPHGLAFDASGNLYIADLNNNCIRMVTPSGIISTVVGIGHGGFSGDGGMATSAQLNSPETVAFDVAGNLYIGDWGNHRVREVFNSTTAPPTFTPPAGTYASTQSITIADTTPNATIYYTTNGTTPTTSSTVYTGPIPVAASETIEAIAIAPGYTASPVATAAYIISIPIPQAATPTFSPPAGTYTSTQSVTISDTTPGATIYYTTNGTTPTTSSTVYTTPITVSTSETLEAIAIAPGYTTSPVATAAYTIQIPASTCTTPGPGIICTIAGNGLFGYSGDGGPATSAELAAPQSVAVDNSGNLYFADLANNRIRKVTSAGIISTVAGNGTQGYSGEGGPATNAELNNPYGVALDSSGDLYIVDLANSRIRKVTPAGIISTVAGNGTQGYSGDGGTATNAELSNPNGIALDSNGNLYIADTGNLRVRKVTPAGLISTVAGNGASGYSGDGATANAAGMDPFGVTVDSNGNLFIADLGNSRIRKVTSAGLISTVAGSGAFGYSGDGGAATAAELSYPVSVTVDAGGNLYIADLGNSSVRKVTATGIISTLAGTGTRGYNGDGILATAAELYDPFGVAVDNSGNLLIADHDNYRIREVFASTTAAPTFTPPAGTYTSTQTVTLADATPNATIYYTTNGTTPTTSSTVYTAPITVTTSQTLEAIAIAPGYTPSPVVTAAYIIQAATPGSCVGLPSGSICTVAGNGIEGFAGDGGPATSAKIFEPTGVALDSSGNLYIADTQNDRIRLVSASGIISTVAGYGLGGALGDGGSALSASIGLPDSVAVDSTGNFYFNDPVGSRVRKVTPAGIISTVAGTGTAGYSGDGGPATSAALDFPRSVALDSSGNLYIADQTCNCVRMVTPAGIITTVAGTGVLGFSGDGGAATSAKLYEPRGLAIDPGGNLYIADESNNRIRKVTPAGIISTFAGNGTFGFSGDGGAATNAKLGGPSGVAVDSSGNLYIADGANCRIRKVTPAGLITTIAGNGTACSIGSYTGDGGPATGAELSYPQGVAVDSLGNLYIADSDNSRIRKVIH